MPHAARIAAATLLLAILGGCQTEKAPGIDAGTPAAQAARERIMRADPNARVGFVIELLPSENLAAIGDATMYDFPPLAAVIVMDTNNNPVARGVVVRADSQHVHFQYEPLAGGRNPQVGDTAVHFAQ